MFSKEFATFKIPISRIQGFQFIQILTDTYFFFASSYYTLPIGCQLLSHCAFDLHLSNN